MHNKAVISFKKKYLHIVCFTMAICTLFFTKIVFSEQYQLKLIVDLNEFKDVSSEAIWLEPLSSNINDDEFFVAQVNGIIYLTGKDKKTTQQPILNLSLKINNPTFISLTAMTLHPSFTRAGQSGYATIFTAHTTKFDQKTNNSRLTLIDSNINFAFETVITAWQYDFDKQQIDPQTQREVLRIPITTKDSAIQKLTFDPYQKYWNADYGQLYFSLKYIKELQDHPLYSGAILRIYPQAFGDRSYTVSQTNPFVKQPEINDEIVVMGSQNIEHFFWAKNDHASIFIQHNNNQQHRLSKAKIGDNLLTQTRSNFLWSQPTVMSSMLLYQGRNFLNLRNRMVFFTLLDNQWHLSSISLAPLMNESPIFKELVTKEVLSPTSHLNIHQDNLGEIILFDNHKSRMYSLQLVNSKLIEAIAPQSNTSDTGAKRYSLYISLCAALLLLLMFAYRKNINQRQPVELLEKDHLRYKYEPATQSILLFRTNNKNKHQVLSLDDIVRFEVLLNNEVINTINDQPQNALSNQDEVDIRALFTKEHHVTMVDDKIRIIEIILVEKDDSHRVCLYLRKGNNRLTNTTYHQVIDILIDLCWVISKHINAKATETRLIPSVAHFSAPIRQTAKPQPRKDVNIKRSINTIENSKTTIPKPVCHPTQQTEVVDGLDKLVKLHQQGYLSDAEFSLAKAKLLK
ncbi:MAG: hypothetical protein ACJASL_000226 [Paraglaciecola sp.]|jgi:hypothetical protein